MGEVLNPVEIEQRIAECANRIARGVMVVSERHQEFLDAEREYDRAFALAYVQYDGPAHMRRYDAELSTGKERAARDVADVAHQAAKRQWQALQAELEALRSIGASVRQAYATGGGT